MGALNCYCFGVLHSHYVCFLCCLSLNCASDVNQIGNFHLRQRWDGPPLIGVAPVVTQLALKQLQNCFWKAIFLRTIRLRIQMKNTAKLEPSVWPGAYCLGLYEEMINCCTAAVRISMELNKFSEKTPKTTQIHRFHFFSLSNDLFNDVLLGKAEH